jgi:hypothetical protein
LLYYFGQTKFSKQTLPGNKEFLFIHGSLRVLLYL